MKNVMKYISVIASVVAIITVIITGFKLADRNYEVATEGLIIGISLVVLFACAIYNLSRNKE